MAFALQPLERDIFTPCAAHPFAPTLFVILQSQAGVLLHRLWLDQHVQEAGQGRCTLVGAWPWPPRRGFRGLNGVVVFLFPARGVEVRG